MACTVVALNPEYVIQVGTPLMSHVTFSPNLLIEINTYVMNVEYTSTHGCLDTRERPDTL